MSNTNSSVFKGLKSPRSVLEYNLMKGVTDFSNLQQFDFYEKGYPFLIVLKAPDFLVDLSKNNEEIKSLLDNYIHVIEHDFKGIDNVENITGESNGEINNGYRTIQLINKVTKGAAQSFTMRVHERSGSLMTKLNELYLTGIKDPDTGAKTYHGLIDDWTFNGIDTASGKDPGPHREVWAFLYFITDNTVTNIEKAFLIAAAQQTAANFSELYDGDKGDIQFVELSLSFNGFFINNDQISLAAQRALLAMRSPQNKTATRLIVDSTNFTYEAIADMNTRMSDITSNGVNTTENNGYKLADGTDGNWLKDGKLVDTNKDFSGGKIGSVGVSVSGTYSEQVNAIGNNEHIVTMDKTQA